MNDFAGWEIDSPRGNIITPRGENIPIKIHKNWKYINYNGSKISLSSIEKFLKENIVKGKRSYDIVLDYMMSDDCDNYPCSAVHYWLIKYRLFKVNNTAEFKEKFKHLFVHHKPIKTKPPL